MDPEAAVNEFVRRAVAKDLDGLAELVSDDIEYDNVPMGKNHGPEELRNMLGAMVGHFDEIEFLIHRQTCSGNVVMNERTDRFRIGEKWIELPVAGVFEVNDDGKITLWRDYFDLAMMTSQMS